MKPLGNWALVLKGYMPTVFKGDTGIEEMAQGPKARQHSPVAPTSEGKKRGIETEGGLVLLLLQNRSMSMRLRAGVSAQGS